MSLVCPLSLLICSAVVVVAVVAAVVVDAV